MLNEIALRHFLKAETFLENGEIDQSITQLKAALSVAPDYAEAHYNLGVLLERKKQYPQAMLEYQRAISCSQGIIQAHLNLGALLTNRGQFKEAIAIYRKALYSFPKAAKLHYNLANALDRQGLLDDAVIEYRVACEIDPTFIQAFNNLGRTLLRCEDWLGAIIAYQEAAEIDVSWETIHFGLGCAYAKVGRTTEAIAELKMALHLAPQDIDSMIELSHCFLIQAAKEKNRESVRLAQITLAKARALRPYDVRIYKAIFVARKLRKLL